MIKLTKSFLLHNKRSICSFLAVGGLAAAINFSSFALLLDVFKLNYLLATSIAFVLSVIFHFTANRFFTFQAHATHFKHQLPKYALMIALNYTITFLIVRFTVEKLHLSPYIGLILSIGTTVNTGFLLSRYWVFKPRNK